MRSPKAPVPCYEIRVEGELGDMWVEWFEGLSIRREPAPGSNRVLTVLSGPIPDQPAMHAVLNKIRDLNLTLVSVNRCQAGKETSSAT
ncbi:MAG: hypothetical protein ACM3QS_14950 [Bacteroidota bacterium]